MSARNVFTLLVVAVLSLLLTSGSALSRPEAGPRDAFTRVGEVDYEDTGDPDDTGPGGTSPGDDDLWDKPAPGGVDTKTEDVLGVDGRTYFLLSSQRSGERSVRMALWLMLFLRSWLVTAGSR